jgi:hypothetical protein
MKKKLRISLLLIAVCTAFTAPFAVAQTDAKPHNWGLPDSIRPTTGPFSLISVEVTMLYNKKPKYAVELSNRFAGTLERAIYNLTGYTEYWTRFKEKPRLTYLSYEIKNLFPLPISTAQTLIKESLERRYKFRMYDIQDTVPVYVLKNANPAKLMMHVDSIHGERVGGDVDEGIVFCGNQLMEFPDFLEERFKRIVFFEGFEGYDRVVMDFPYAYFDDIKRMRAHLAQWGVELLDEKRLVTLNYVEPVPPDYYNVGIPSVYK